MDHGKYAIDIGSLDISGALGRTRLMEDDNESLLTICMQNIYMDIAFTEGATLIADGKEVSTFTPDTPRTNDRLKDIS